MSLSRPDSRLCLFGLLLTAPLTLTGCHFLLGEGSYRGVLIEATLNAQGNAIPTGPTPTEVLPPITQRHVSIGIKRDHGNQYHIGVFDLNQLPIFVATIEPLGLNKIQIKLPEFFSGTVQLKNEKIPKNSYPGVHFNCASGRSENGRWIRVCRTLDRFVFQVMTSQQGTLLMDLSGVYTSEATPNGLDAPLDMSKNEAIEMGTKQNFKHLIQVKQTVQSIYRARADMLNLLPQADGQALFVFAATSLNFFSLGAYAGSWVPFLLPSKWMKGFEGKNLSEFEKTGLHIARLNLINEIETAVFTLNSDKRYLKYSENELDRAKEFFEELGKKPDKNAFAWRLSHVIAALRLDVAKLRQIIFLDRMAVSFLLGLHNPLAVRKVHVEGDFSHDLLANSNLIHEKNYGNLSAYRVSQEAIHRSLELRQWDYHVKAVTLRNKALYFNWMDPRVDSSQAFSVSLIDIIKAGRVAIEEVKLKQAEQMEIIKSKVYRAVNTYNTAVDTFRIAQEEVGYQTTRLARLKNKALNDIPNLELDLTYLELKDSLRSKLDYYGKLEASLRALWVARADIRRLLLSDVYSQSYPLLPNERPWHDFFNDAEFKRTIDDDLWESTFVRTELEPLPSVPVIVAPPVQGNLPLPPDDSDPQVATSSL